MNYTLTFGTSASPEPERRRIRIPKFIQEIIYPSEPETDAKHFNSGFDFSSVEDQDSQDREFQEQERAFEQIPKEELEQYRGEFVASRNGVIVGHNPDIVALTNWFFSEYGDVAIYMTRIGKPMRVVLRTPLF